MPTSTPRPALACLFLCACLVALLPGCVKYKQTLTVQPDGSGKVELVFGMSDPQLALLGPDADPFAGFSVAALAENPQGFVAFSRPRVQDRGGFRVMSFTGYFDDVSDLGFAGGAAGGEGFDAVSYALSDGVLVVRRPLAGQAAAAFRQEGLDLGDEEVRRVLAPSVAGLELEERFVVPGRVRSAGPLAVDGDAASASVNGADDALGRHAELMDAYAGLDRVEVRFEPREPSAAEAAAWARELRDAKAAWAQIVREQG